MKTITINAANSDYTGESTDLTARIKDNRAYWSNNGYDFTIEITADIDRSKFDVKRDECWFTYKLEGDDWSETLHNGQTCLTNFSSMSNDEIMCSIIRVAHSWISNRI